MQACTICAFRATVILNVHRQEKALRQGFSVALEEKVTSVQSYSLAMLSFSLLFTDITFDITANMKLQSVNQSSIDGSNN